MPVDELPQTKACPDCAESVLAAARKCRFCGYRFDEPRQGAARSWLRRLGWVPQRRAATLTEVLADWGIATESGEAVSLFRYGEVDGQYGYLLLSDRRLVFVADHRRRQDPVFEHPLTRVRAVTASGRGRRLTIHGEDFEHTVRAGSRHSLRALGAAIAEATELR